VIGQERLVVHHTTREDDDNDHGRHHRHHHGGGSGSRTVDHYEHLNHNILEMEYPLHVFSDGKIPVGQYEYPFALQLPENLPSTMKCRRGESNCEIKFEIVAQVYQEQSSTFSLSNITNSINPEDRKELIVEAATSVTKHHDTSLQLPMDIVPINGCCCSRKGSIALETKFNKTTVASSPVFKGKSNKNSNNNENENNSIEVQVRCQNQSTVGVKSVRVELEETVEWTAHAQKEQVRTTLARAEVDASQYPELGRLLHRKVARRRNREIDEDAQSILLERQPWRTIGPIRVPRHARDTYCGRAIQVRHVLTVHLVTEGCCVTNPDVSTFIEIYRKLADSSTIIMDHDAIGEGRHSCGVPSAPLEDNDQSTMITPTAPAEWYDESGTSPPAVVAATAATAPHDYYDEDVATATATAVLVEAQALPPDWNAQTADIVTIPMADAIVLGPSSSRSSGRRGAASGPGARTMT